MHWHQSVWARACHFGSDALGFISLGVAECAKHCALQEAGSQKDKCASANAFAKSALGQKLIRG